MADQRTADFPKAPTRSSTAQPENSGAIATERDRRSTTTDEP